MINISVSLLLFMHSFYLKPSLLLLLFSLQVISNCLRPLRLYVAHRASWSVGFSRQEYWSGLPFPSPGDLPDTGIKPVSHELAGRFFTPESPRKPEDPFTTELEPSSLRWQVSKHYLLHLPSKLPGFHP